MMNAAFLYGARTAPQYGRGSSSNPVKTCAQRIN